MILFPLLLKMVIQVILFCLMVNCTNIVPSWAEQKYSFTFDKVFDHKASQEDVFVEISQLVQSALDGYKVVSFPWILHFQLVSLVNILDYVSLSNSEMI